MLHQMCSWCCQTRQRQSRELLIQTPTAWLFLEVASFSPVTARVALACSSGDIFQSDVKDCKAGKLFILSAMWFSDRIRPFQDQILLKK